MFQSIIALIIIAFFLLKLIRQKQNKQIQNSEFIMWLCFWLLAALLIIFLKNIDQLVSGLGFSGSGIQIMFYISVVILFYFIFRIRLRLAKLDKTISKVVEKVALEQVGITNTKKD